MTTPQRSIRLTNNPASDLAARTFTQGEIFYDETTGTLVLFDGKTAGGIPLLRADLSNQSSLTSIVVSDTQPASSADGALWFNSSNGGLYVSYSSQWVQSSNNSAATISQNTGGSSYITANDLATILQSYVTSSALQSINAIADFVISGASFTSKNTNEDISLISNGTGAVNVIGTFKVTTTSNHKLIESLPNNTVNFYVPNVNSLDSAVDIVGSTTGATVSPQNTGVMFHITGQPSLPSRLYNDGANSYAGYFGRRYNGSTESPTAVNASNLITRLGATPYTTSGWPALTTTRIDMVALDNQTSTAQGSEIQFWTTPAGTATISKNLTVNSLGVTFSDGTIQNSAGIPLTQKGVANGVATLGSDGKIVNSQLPLGGISFAGIWSAATNTPTLTNGTGTAGTEYIVSTGGSVNFGGGIVTFNAGDYVIYSGATWQRIPSSVGVNSFNSRTGAISLTLADVTSVLSSGSITNTMLVNNSITINTGAGLTGGGVASLGSTITLANAGVTSTIAGSGIGVSASTGNVTITNTGVTSVSAGTGISVSQASGNIIISNNSILYVRKDSWSNTPGYTNPFNLFDVNPTVQSNTRYYYEITIAGTGTGGTNGHVAFGWGTSGSATISQYTFLGRFGAGSSQVSISTFTSSYAITSGSVAPDLANWFYNQTVQNTSYTISGFIDITTGGSIIPQLWYQSGGGTTNWQAGSKFLLTPVGVAGVNTTFGTWT